MQVRWIRLLTQAFAQFGQVDVLVNNAGYGVAGAIEEVSEAEFMPMFETNVFGLIRVTRAFLPHLRKQRSGHILNLSSIGGLSGGPGIGLCTTPRNLLWKGFRRRWLLSLRRWVMHVTIIEPGPFRTDFLGRSGVIAARQHCRLRQHRRQHAEVLRRARWQAAG